RLFTILKSGRVILEKEILEEDIFSLNNESSIHFADEHFCRLDQATSGPDILIIIRHPFVGDHFMYLIMNEILSTCYSLVKVRREEVYLVSL
ncbi:unnamed protein product, partial [Allacma fusca]